MENGKEFNQTNELRDPEIIRVERPGKQPPLERLRYPNGTIVYRLASPNTLLNDTNPDMKPTDVAQILDYFSGQGDQIDPNKLTIIPSYQSRGTAAVIVLPQIKVQAR